MVLGLVIAANQLAVLAGPYLVKLGIDSGIPPRPAAAAAIPCH